MSYGSQLSRSPRLAVQSLERSASNARTVAGVTERTSIERSRSNLILLNSDRRYEENKCEVPNKQKRAEYYGPFMILIRIAEFSRSYEVHIELEGLFPPIGSVKLQPAKSADDIGIEVASSLRCDSLQSFFGRHR